MRAAREDCRPLGPDLQSNSAERVAEQRLRSDDFRNLFRAFIATELADKGPEPNSFAAGQHDCLNASFQVLDPNVLT
jgi:hypothetical protein